MDAIPRRIRFDLMSPAEKAIQEAIWEVEKLPADVELTNAVILLQDAKNKVSDFLDKQEANSSKLIEIE